MKVKILKPKKKCYLCGRKKNLTFHHILPQREAVLDNPSNIMILCRIPRKINAKGDFDYKGNCHDLIDLPKPLRTQKVYLDNINKIDKYNSYILEHKLPKYLLWKPKQTFKKSCQKNS